MMPVRRKDMNPRLIDSYLKRLTLITKLTSLFDINSASEDGVARVGRRIEPLTLLGHDEGRYLHSVAPCSASLKYGLKKQWRDSIGFGISKRRE